MAINNCSNFEGFTEVNEAVGSFTVEFGEISLAIDISSHLHRSLKRRKRNGQAIDLFKKMTNKPGPISSPDLKQVWG